MGYPSTVDSGGVIPHSLYAGDLSGYGSNAVSANTAYFVGVVLYSPALLTGIRVAFTSGGHGNYDVGIYDSSGNLINNKGAAVSSTAVLTYSPTNPIPLSGGRYWLALWCASASDTVNSRLAAAANSAVVQSVSVSSNLPSTMSGAANTTFVPLIEGILSGAWS